MSDLPVNKPVAASDAIIHAAIIDVALEAAILGASAAQPWLKLPIISAVFRWGATQAAAYIDKYVEQAAAFAIMDVQTSQEAAQYQTAANGLKQAVESGNADAINQASQNFDDTLSKLIHFDGA